MKRVLNTLLLLVLVLMPLNTNAKEIDVLGKKYTALNYEETLKDTNIKKQYDHYEETDDQVIIYLFRGKECEYCEEFLNYLSSITNEYGSYFKMLSFEIYDSKDNTELLEEVADAIGAPGEGIPLIVIGGKYYEGYSSEYEERILEAIKTNYETPVEERLDIINTLNSINKSTSYHRTASSDFKVIAFNFLFIMISTVIILLFVNNKFNKLDDKISMIRNKK